jgi:YbbR domain-containing protein
VVASTRRTFTDIPVKVTGLKEGQSYKLVSETDRVSVTVEGAKSLLDKLQPTDLQVFVDAANQAAGTHEVRLQITTPNFIKAVQMQPETLLLDFVK